jgi:hypothetical protein
MMASRNKRVLPKKPAPRQGTWVKVDRPFKRLMDGNEVLFLGTEFEKTFDPDGRATLIHVLQGQKQYAISVMPSGALQVVALSGLEGIYQHDEEGKKKFGKDIWKNSIIMLAKDDPELVIEPEEAKDGPVRKQENEKDRRKVRNDTEDD